MADTSLNLSYLKNVSMGNRDFELKMLNTFVEQTNLEMEKIRESHRQEDWGSVSASVHKIKPSFHFIGALNTEMLLNKIEEYGKHKINLEKLPELVNKFLSSCKKIIEEVKIEAKKYQI